MKALDILKKVRARALKMETHEVVLCILAVSQFFSVFGRFIPKAEYVLMLTVLAIGVISEKEISRKALWTALSCFGVFVLGIIASLIVDNFNNNIFLCVGFSANCYLFVSLATWEKAMFSPQKLDKTLDTILMFGVASCAYNLLVNVGEMLTMKPDGYAYGVNFSAFYAGRNEFAYYLILHTAVCTYQLLSKKKAKYLAAEIFFLLNLFLTFSRASILSVAVFIVALMINYIWTDSRLRKLVLKASVPVLILAAIVIWLNFDFLDQYLFRTSYGDSYRSLLWETGWKYFLQSPLVGYGPGPAEYMLVNLAENTANSFHNTYVEVLVWGGIALTVLYLFLIIHLIKRIKYIRTHNKIFCQVYVSLCAAALVYGMFETNMLFAMGAKGVVTTVIFYVIPMLYAAALRKMEKAQAKKISQYPQQDLISVIIPAYNAQDTLGACLDSLQAQSYQNFEAIIIDDGSEDETGAIARAYEAKDPRFIYYRKENGGQSSARNVGLVRMRGSLFTYVDSDDYIMPDMLMQLYMCMKDASADMSMCAMVRKQGNKETVMYAYDKHVVNGTEQIYGEFLAEKYVFGPVCKLFSSKVYADVFFLEGTIFEDIEMLSRAYLRSRCIALCPYPGYVATVRDGSTTQSAFDSKKLDLLSVTHIIQKRAQESGIDCEQELMAFVLNGYLSVLLMASDSGKLQEYRQVCDPLVQWIRKRERIIYISKVIPLRKKVYAWLFARKHPAFMKFLVSVRSGLK